MVDVVSIQVMVVLSRNIMVLLVIVVVVFNVVFVVSLHVVCGMVGFAMDVVIVLTRRRTAEIRGLILLDL